MHQSFAVLALMAGFISPFASGADGADDGFQSLFDGRTLDGWETPALQYWTVESGAIVGRITKERPCTINQYLVWKGGELADFELKVKSRLNGEGGINNGFQFRSRLLPDHDVCGYQMDNNLQTPWLARLYDEYGRHTLAMRGERAVFDMEGRRTATPIAEAAGPAWFRLEDWHEYHLVCRGTDLSLRVDGRLAAEVQDNDPRRAEPQGILALQLHSGPPTVVEFKDIRLKVLKPAAIRPPKPTPSDKLIALQREAVAWWDLDTGGHGARPALRHIPGWDRFELNVRAAGPGARLGNDVVVLDGAYFESSPDIALGSREFTVFLRACDPKGQWNGALVAKSSGGGPGPFRLHGIDLPETPGPDFVFEVTTDAGTGRVSFPVGGTGPDAWHDLVARYDGTTLAIFKDGRRVASADWKGTLANAAGPLLIGAEFEAGKAVRHFHGELETAACWSRALDDGEVAALSSFRSY